MATSLTLNQKQKLQVKLSPAQIQVMRMLELPACELQARINEELQDNPALDEGRNQTIENEGEETNSMEDNYNDPTPSNDYNDDDDDDGDRYANNSRSMSAMREDIPFSVGISFGEHLKAQIYLTKMDKPDRHIAKFVVGNIDSDGYLRRTIEELVDDLLFREGLTVTIEKMQEIVDQVKQFEPSGVGAYDLQECLLLQLQAKEPTPDIQLAITIISKAFQSFSKKQYTKLTQKLNITEDQLRAAIAEIRHLNPKPGSGWIGTVYDRNQTIVTPDFIVEQEENDELLISLNYGDIPSLRVSNEYSQMLDMYSQNENHLSEGEREAVRFVKTKIDAANWFIEAIQKRNETLMQTMKAIVACQREFFLNGDSMYLKPMVLRDIADRINMDISTVSRACSNKYVQTQFGIFPLKYFFSEAILTQKGEEVSTREIKQKLRELVDNEDKNHPITDDELVEILHQSGYSIARRTVAKYREKMGIPVARVRHQMK